MKTKVVYVLVSNRTDTYLEQALISVFSLREKNPEVEVVLVVDENTNSTLVDDRSLIKEFVNSVITIDVPEVFSKRQSSRYLKTNLRNLISGDYLFIDTDTIIVDDLSSIDFIQEDIIMAYNTNSPIPVSDSDRIGDRYMKINSKKVGWKSFIGYTHYNSGVIYAKDCDSVKELYNRWYINWSECVKCGVDTDQMALIKSNEEVGEIIHPMEDIFNWQIQRHGSWIPTGTKILHYFASDYNHTAFIFAKDAFLRQIKNNGFPTDLIRYYLNHIEKAFEIVTYVTSEDDYKLLKELKATPLFSLRNSHPSIFSLLNKIVFFIRRIRLLFLKRQ